jgi:pimeloyl-ACP methyl ester carboxylesterase
MEGSCKKIYCIPGLGVDEKIFDGIHLPGFQLVHLSLIKPIKKESLAAYAKRLITQIDDRHPIIIGVSFGGMIAIEIAKQIALEKLIIISGVKKHKEIPRWMRISGALRIHKIVPVKSTRFTERADNRRIGIKTDEEKRIVMEYRKRADKNYIAWALDKILNWKNTWIPERLYHIHGDEDRLFPINKVAATHVIKQGTHIMLVNMVDEINACLHDILKD